MDNTRRWQNAERRSAYYAGEATFWRKQAREWRLAALVSIALNLMALAGVFLL